MAKENENIKSENISEISEIEKLSLENLDQISGGYIVKDDAGYHVIEDNRGYEIYTFTEDQYNLMMRLIRDKWQISEEYITWDDVKEIKKKHQKEMGINPEEFRP